MQKIRKSYPDSEELASDIVSKFGKDGGNIFDVLSHYCPQYGLKFQVVEERSAIRAVWRGRWIVAAFSLSVSQWDRFSDYFDSFPMGVLTADILGSEEEHLLNSSVLGHAVVLTTVDHGMLTFRNSWGKDWGYNGHFRVEKASVFKNCLLYTSPSPRDRG
eukprot:3460559-Rhodomonas_salina.1